MPRRRVIDIHDPILTDEQWAKLEPLLPEPKASAKGGAKPTPNRPVVEGLLWILVNGARWRSLPKEYPSPATCWRRLRDWEDSGVWLKAWHTYLDNLNKDQRLNWEEAFADGSFAPAKKGATELAKPRKERIQSGWWWSMVKEFRWHVISPAPRRRK
jgi:transposase